MADIQAGQPLPQRNKPRDLRDLILIDNWIGSIVAIIGGLVVSFVLFGYMWPYWRIADMDFWIIYEGWLQNDGLPQEGFYHPGYLTILSIGGWYRLLHVVGLLDVHALSGLPAAPAEAEIAWTAAARAGRVLSLLLASGYVVAFAYLVRRLIGDWRVAILAAFALAFSGGLEMYARIMRTELIASGGVIIALLLLLIVARGPRRDAWRPVIVGLAALCATLGFVNKVQVIFLICALPVMVLPFGRPSAGSDDFWRKSRRAVPFSVGLALCAASVAMPATRLFMIGLSQAPSMGLKPFLFDTFGAYQVAVAAWIIISMIAFARWWQVSATETFAAMMCVVIGISVGLLSLDIRYHLNNVIVVANPLEQLLEFIRTGDPIDGNFLSMLANLARGFRVVLGNRTFVLDTSARPTVFLEWLVIACAIVAWRGGNRTLAIQAAVLILVGWAIDTTSAARGLKLQYFILTDPLIIIAAALLIANVPAFQTHRYAYAIGFLILAAHVTISQAEPVKITFQTSKPLMYCVEYFDYTKRIRLYPFCPTPSSGLGQSTVRAPGA